MLHIRKTKTSSDATAIQVVKYVDRKMVVMKHVGSAKSREQLDALVTEARLWIEEYTGQLSLPATKQERGLLFYPGVDRCIDMRYSCAHAVLRQLLEYMGFSRLGDHLLTDLVIMRLFEPSSKLHAIELLYSYFNIRYARCRLYRKLPEFLAYKEKAEAIAISFAKKQLKSDLSFVLYDVTTLFFESFKEDDLRKHGFSKDNKPAQP